jgi:anaerobic ribonucleoside-triphosphate reductase
MSTDTDTATPQAPTHQVLGVIKRSGATADFDPARIESAIARAGRVTGEFDDTQAARLTLAVTAMLAADGAPYPHVEHVQDLVERALLQGGHTATAASYVAYRDEHARLRSDAKTFVDVGSSINEYLDRSDWRVNANANQGYSLGGMILNTAGKVVANYWLSHVYAPEIGRAHRDGDLHIHDLDMLAGYCFTGDTRIRLLDGTNRSFAELYESGETDEVHLFAFDEERNTVVPAVGRNLRITRHVTALAHVTLDNGETISCTPDHPFLLRDGQYIAAGELTAGTSLMPLYVSDVWREANNARLVSYNQSSNKRAAVSEMASLRPRTAAGVFYNHKVASVRLETLADPIPVFDLEVPKHHNFALEAGVFVHNCAGWSLRTLLEEGLNGVPGKVESTAPKHFSSAIGQIVNFLGTMQNEWAGAQAFSSFDTYMAPFLRLDQLTYDEVLQKIQELVFNLNVPSRWGCVDTDTEVLSTDGWKRYDELCEADTIYTWKDGQLNTCPVNKVVVKPFVGKLHSYRGRNYDQTVSPNHRVLTFDHNTRESRIRISEDIFSVKTPYALPVRLAPGALKESDLGDEQIMLAAMLYADGHIDYRDGAVHKVTYYKSPNRWGAEQFENICETLGLEYTRRTVKSDIGHEHGYPAYQTLVYSLYGDSARNAASLIGRKDEVDPQFQAMDARQSEMFLDTWMRHDGDPVKEKIQCDNEAIAAAVQHIALRSGRTSYLVQRDATTWVKLRKVESIIPTERVEVDYDGLVWCPNVEDGTAIFRKNGSVYISGQTQTPFTNLTFDWVCPADLREQRPMIGGVVQDFTYGDCAEEMAVINQAYIEVMTKGDATGRTFTFPIPTYNITEDFDWESPNADRLFEMTAKYGTPYFQNFINSELDPSQIRSMCCRLQLDLRELLKRGNGLFGSAEQTGSLGVVTINCARLGYTHVGDEAGLLAALDVLMDLAKDSLELKRTTIDKLIVEGLFPYTKRYLSAGLANHFSTIGVNGVNEMIRNLTGDAHDITTPEGHAIAIRLLDHVRARMVEFQEETGHLYNLEATPAEGTTYRFAKEDKKRFAGILQAGTDDSPYYTNSSQLPAGFTDDPFEALDRQDELQTKYTGGTVLHLYMSERMSTAAAAKELVKRSLATHHLPYITITPTFSICPAHGYIAGEHQTCPTCQGPCEVWTRVMGYFRPVSSFNIGKKAEHAERQFFTEKAAQLS